MHYGVLTWGLRDRIHICMVIQVVVAPPIPVNIRDHASQFLISLIDTKPKRVIKLKLVEHLIKAAFMLLIQPDRNPFAAGEMTAQKIGVDLLDALSMEMPNKKEIFQICLANALNICQSQNYFERKGGHVVLAVLAEGCSEFLKENLKQLLDVICLGIKDSEPLVREAACVALTQFSDHVQPDITEYHAVTNFDFVMTWECCTEPNENVACIVKNLHVSNSFSKGRPSASVYCSG